MTKIAVSLRSIYSYIYCVFSVNIRSIGYKDSPVVAFFKLTEYINFSHFSHFQILVILY